MKSVFSMCVLYYVSVRTDLDVRPVHGDVCVPVWSVLLVLEAEGVEQLVHHHLEVDTPVLLQPDLHPPVPEPRTPCYLHLHLRGVVAHL